jgi:UDP-N-acetylglucosamine 2-epimerase (non-hydrolysing)
MIHIFVGTKAQFIKMMPIMRELDRRGIVYNFIDSGQHAGLTGGLIQQFGLRKPDVFLRQEYTNINRVAQAIAWTIRHLARLVLRRKSIYREIFKGKNGICLIHGDTLSTVISLLYAKRCRIPVAHVESGLRSFHLFDPLLLHML